jgi:hypothetical protein
VTEIFDRFRDKHTAGFLDKITDPVFDSDISDAPELVWRELQRAGGRMSPKRLNELVKQAQGNQKIRPQRIFEMLRSTGLIRAADDAWRRASIDVEIIPSILTLDIPEQRNVRNNLREQLVADLCDVLASIHRMASDFFRTDPKTKAREIVPEAVFSAGLVLGLEPRGWKVEREAQSATGRTDIKARHDRFGEQWIVVEVKIWGRNDYAEIHSQVTSYWTKDVVALATVMVTDHQDQGWADEYDKKCLDGKVTSYDRKAPSPMLSGHFIARSDICLVEETDHFLLQLPKRR